MCKHLMLKKVDAKISVNTKLIQQTKYHFFSYIFHPLIVMDSYNKVFQRLLLQIAIIIKALKIQNLQV